MNIANGKDIYYITKEHTPETKRLMVLERDSTTFFKDPEEDEESN